MNKIIYRLITPYDFYYKKSLLSYNFIYKHTNYKSNYNSNNTNHNSLISKNNNKPIFTNNISNIYNIQKN